MSPWTTYSRLSTLDLDFATSVTLLICPESRAHVLDFRSNSTNLERRHQGIHFVTQALSWHCGQNEITVISVIFYYFYFTALTPWMHFLWPAQVCLWQTTTLSGNRGRNKWDYLLLSHCAGVGDPRRIIALMLSWGSCLKLNGRSITYTCAPVLLGIDST